MPNSLRDRLAVIFREVFADDDLSITDETTAQDVNGWDSLNTVAFFQATAGSPPPISTQTAK